MNWKWAIYKMCNDCKKKVEKSQQTCSECKKENFSFKYNCGIDLQDGTGTISCIAFDPICQKLFSTFIVTIDQSANDYSQLNEDQIKELVQNLVGEEFRFNIENKNNRLIIRALERECKGNFSSPPSEQV